VIASIRGRLAHRRPEQVVVEINGLGYELFVSLNTFYQLPAVGAEVSLRVQTVVREDAFLLYGFATEEEKEAFARLIGVSGVGPRVAVGLLSGVTPAELWEAVRSRDTERLTKVPGVGKKTASRLVLELEGRLPAAAAGEAEPAAAGHPLWEDAMSALTNLGYSEAAAQRAVEKAVAELGPEPGLEDILKHALKAIK
jgi:Holliday junction DNA helicase RuvA